MSSRRRVRRALKARAPGAGERRVAADSSRSHDAARAKGGAAVDRAAADAAGLRLGRRGVWFALAALLLVFLWAYWPVVTWLVDTWLNEPDYSHGILVIPLAGVMLWLRGDTMPRVQPRHPWVGLLLVLGGCAVYFLSAFYYLDAIAGWSVLLWIAGVVWLFGGWPLLRWAGPAVFFLVFMLPLPYRAERLLSVSLQGIATRVSTWMLQVLGQPALTEGHTILLGDYRLEVVDACSGMRIFVSVAAVAVGYIILVPRPWWQRLLLLASTAPIAVIVNASRIVATGLLWRFVSGPAAARFSHDFAGWMMVPAAILLFGLVLWYLDCLFPEVDAIGVRAAVSRRRGKAAGSG
jgi:exosortase